MKITLSILCLILSFGSIAQLKLTPILFPKSQLKNSQANQAIKTLNLPFWEDFSTSGNNPDTLKWNNGKNVFVNDALSINTPTYKAATLDGLKGDGNAYDIENELPGKSDSLESHYIDLSAFSIADSIFFSFYWQAGGLSEIPDEEDSLILNFLGDDNQWIQKLAIAGGIDNINDHFKQEIIRIDSPKFFHEKFQFRFEIIGKGNGPFDTWHLDYIYLNKDRSLDDTLHFDQALTGKPTALFGLYREMPAHIFFKSPESFLSNQSVIFSNLENNAEPVETYYQRIENLVTNEVYLNEIVSRPNPNIEPLSFDTLTTTFIGSIAAKLNPLDSQIIQTTIAIFTGDNNLFEVNTLGDTIFYPIDLKINDTIRQNYTLQNHYAYDDGIAEYAGGVDEIGDQLAIRFSLPEPDTMTHVDIHFPNIDPNSIDRSIEVRVWSDIERDRVLISQSYTIEPNTKLNEFKRIKLNRSQLVKDTIYVGFRQLDNDYLPIGFDNTNPEASGEIFSNTTGTWEQNERLKGIFMIRPVFQLDSTFILTRKSGLSQVNPYPNPSLGIVNFNEVVNNLSVYSLDGSLVYKGHERSLFDISFLNNGIYLLNFSIGTEVKSTRLIINR